MTKFLKNPEKPYFCHIFPIFVPLNPLLQYPALPCSTSHKFLTPYQISGKSKYQMSRKRPDRQKDRTDLTWHMTLSVH